MPEPFIRLDRQQFLDLVLRFPFRRRIASVHMHHTWRPRRRDYRGLATILAMRDFHVSTNGWADIAQHVTIDPEGGIWTGRDWNARPASAVGFNGNLDQGPFMFEMIGNFDRGEDPFDGPQREAAVLVVAAVQLRFGLSPDSLRFHRDMSRKTCPGSGIDYTEVLELVSAAQSDLREASRQVAESWATPASLAYRTETDRVILAASGRLSEGWARGNGATPEEPTEEEMSLEQQLASLGDRESLLALAADRGGIERDADLTPALLDNLRPHLVNLRQGRLSTGGKVSTSIRDLDAMFAELDRWVATGGNGPRRIVLYAHGGLVSESGGLRVALNHVEWWKSNDVYPIYFAWETGFVETLAQMLAAGAERQRAAVGARDLSDVTDWLIEQAARVPGPAIWGAMKRSAERAFDDEGDQRGAESNARAVIRRLLILCSRHPGKVQLHGIGHSAGAIFQIHLLRAYEGMRSRAAVADRPHLPSFASLQFLAPAATAELYLRQLHPLIGTAVDHLSIFTMRRRAELDDNCIGLYRKSLLYLIYHALEDRVDTDVLGLQECLESRELKEAVDSSGGDIVYSPSQPGSESGRQASRAMHHGSFDEDDWTMNSVLCRVVDRDPHELKRPFPDSAQRAPVGDILSDARRWRTIVTSVPEPQPAKAEAAVLPPAVTPKPESVVVTAPSGRRRALCVGIDRYPDAPLAGCVNDAKSWANVLRDRFGFEQPTMLLDGEGTREKILGTLTDLVRSAEPGDVLAFVYAGHGTELPDVDGDEIGGTNGPTDEALCPVDYATGAFLIDDDLRRVLSEISAGVSLTCFFDCCHSGSGTRIAVGLRARERGEGMRARFVPSTPELIAAHLRFREQQRALAPASRAMAPGGVEAMRHVLFSACSDREVAYEQAGSGAFTGHSVSVLKAITDVPTNAEFQDRVTHSFGAAPSQHPELDCAPGWEQYRLFQGTTSGEPGRAAMLPIGRRVVRETFESILKESRAP